MSTSKLLNIKPNVTNSRLVRLICLETLQDPQITVSSKLQIARILADLERHRVFKPRGPQKWRQKKSVLDKLCHSDEIGHSKAA